MHPTIEELLALRDGEGAPERGRHLDQCPVCARQVAEMNELQIALRDLPALEPPVGGWPRILIERRRRRAQRTATWAAAAAAMVVLAVTAGLLLRPGASGPRAVDAVLANDVVELIDASRELEMVLRSPSLRSPVLRPAEAARIVALEDRVAVIDSQLAVVGEALPRDREVALWSGRVELLDELVRARGGWTQVPEVRYAVNGDQGRQP